MQRTSSSLLRASTFRKTSSNPMTPLLGLGRSPFDLSNSSSPLLHNQFQPNITQANIAQAPIAQAPIAPMTMVSLLLVSQICFVGELHHQLSRLPVLETESLSGFIIVSVTSIPANSGHGHGIWRQLFPRKLNQLQ